MDASSYFSTPKNGYHSSEEEEDLLKKKEYIAKYNSDFITIIIGKTKNNIIIRSSFYELKVDIENLSLLTKTIFKSIDEAFEFMNNIFNQNKFKIQEKSSNIIKLIIKTYDLIKGKEKEIELCLVENFENKNRLIKELFCKYISIEKKINEVKNDNKIIKEENDKLKQYNTNLKMEIESIKNNHNNDIGGLQMQIMNMINSYQQQIDKLLQQINGIYYQLNILSKNNFNSMNNFYDFDSMNNVNHCVPMDRLNNFNNFDSINNDQYSPNNFKEVTFRCAGFNSPPFKLRLDFKIMIKYPV